MAVHSGARRARRYAVFYRKCDQFRRVFAKVSEIAPCPAGLDVHVAALCPAQLLQLLQKRRDVCLPLGIVYAGATEHADAPHDGRPRRERPRRSYASERGYELPSTDVECHLIRP